MSVWARIAGIVGLLPAMALSAAASEPWMPRSERYVTPLPPAYPEPPRGFVPLPRSGVPLRFPSAPSSRPGSHPVWIPGQTDVVVGLDGRGRITHILEYVPGHFGR